MGRVNIFYWPNDVAGKMQTCFWAHKPDLKQKLQNCGLTFAVSFSPEAGPGWLNSCLISQLCE